MLTTDRLRYQSRCGQVFETVGSLRTEMGAADEYEYENEYEREAEALPLQKAQ